MAWLKGQSGNPKGRPRGGETLRDILKQRLNKRDKAAIIDKLVLFAMAGDMKAMALVLDNHDGRLPNRTELTGGTDDNGNEKPIPIKLLGP